MSQGRRSRNAANAPVRGLRFGPVNYAAFALGVLSIIAGYMFLDRGSVTAAPLLLILGYAVFLPAGLILGWRRLS